MATTMVCTDFTISRLYTFIKKMCFNHKLHKNCQSGWKTLAPFRLNKSKPSLVTASGQSYQLHWKTWITQCLWITICTSKDRAFFIECQLRASFRCIKLSIRRKCKIQVIWLLNTRYYKADFPRIPPAGAIPRRSAYRRIHNSFPLPICGVPITPIWIAWCLHPIQWLIAVHYDKLQWNSLQYRM